MNEQFRPRLEHSFSWTTIIFHSSATHTHNPWSTTRSSLAQPPVFSTTKIWIYYHVTFPSVPVTFWFFLVLRFGLAALAGDRQTPQHLQGLGGSTVACSLPCGTVPYELSLTYFQQNVERAWWSSVVIPGNGMEFKDCHGAIVDDHALLIYSNWLYRVI